jgi:outer membrane protein TolC
MAFDTLSYARRLRQAGVPEPQAEAIADATRELVMEDVASKSDIASVKSDIAGVKADLVALEQRLTAAMETLSLRLTVRMGVMLAAGLSLMTALISLLIRSH